MRTLRTRRQVLALSAGAVATATAAGGDCAAQPAKANWADLAQRLGDKGRLIAPGSAEHAGIKPYNARFDCVRSTTYVRPADVEGVRRVLVWAAEKRQTLAVRGGGHSFEGKSTHPQLVLDMSKLERARLTPANALEVEAGVRLGDVYKILTPKNLVLPGGTCPTVGLIGHALGGGIGDFLPMFGYAAQSITDVTMVTFGGTALKVTDQSISPIGGAAPSTPLPDARELMQALRGGGQGMFGVVTAMTFRTHDVSQSTLATFRLAGADSLSLEQATATILAWFAWREQLPVAWRKFVSAKLNLSRSGGRYGIDIAGVAVTRDGEASLQDLRRSLGPLFALPQFKSKRFNERVSLDVAIRSFLDDQETTTNAKRQMLYGASSMFERALPQAAVARMLRDLGGNYASLYTAGGASQEGIATSLHPAAYIVEWSRYAARREAEAHRRLSALKSEVAALADAPDRSFPNYPDNGGSTYFSNQTAIERLRAACDPFGLSTASVLAARAAFPANCG